MRLLRPLFAAAALSLAAGAFLPGQASAHGGWDRGHGGGHGHGGSYRQNWYAPPPPPPTYYGRPWHHRGWGPPRGYYAQPRPHWYR